jgi:hypothetical protein
MEARQRIADFLWFSALDLTRSARFNDLAAPYSYHAT